MMRFCESALHVGLQLVHPLRLSFIRAFMFFRSRT